MSVTQQLKDVLQHHDGFRVRSYSGRLMYGKECLAVSCADPTDLLMLLAENAPDVLKALGKPKMDDLGKGAICYWPQTPAPDDDCEEEQK